jgi:hypothetical protein
MLETKKWILDAGYLILDAGYWMLDFVIRDPVSSIQHLAVSIQIPR